MKPFPLSETSPIEHSAPLPKTADCVVIGGGVIGVTTALYLARQGQRVVLLEKGRVSAEQSSRNWGWIRVQGRDAAEIPMAIEAQHLWRELAAQVDTDIGLKQVGVAYLAGDEKTLKGYRTWLQFAQKNNMDSCVLDAAGTKALIPSAKADWNAALYTPSDMRAEPFLAVPALARLAASEGVMIRENCAVRRLETDMNCISGVVTEHGVIATKNVVVAAGAWSSLFLRCHGINIPQLSVASTVAQTEKMDAVFTGGAADERLAFRHRADGGYTLAPASYHELFIGPDALRNFPKFVPQLRSDPLGTAFRLKAPPDYPDAWGTSRDWSAEEVSPFERIRILNPAPNAKKVDEITQRFGETFPHLGKATVKRAWAGMIDVMPDVLPVVDIVESLPGLVVATGMCGHGFGIGPAFGRITADLVLGRAPGHDLHKFRFSRFSDGSKIELGSGL